jgi:hypothetical protein
MILRNSLPGVITRSVKDCLALAKTKLKVGLSDWLAKNRN